MPAMMIDTQAPSTDLARVSPPIVVVPDPEMSGWYSMLGTYASRLPTFDSITLVDYPPINPTDVVTKEYVDSVVVGGTAGVASFNGRVGMVTLLTPDISAAGGMIISGDTMTGPLVLNADPTLPLGAATKQYVDTKAGAIGGPFLPLSGGVLTGPLYLARDPTVANEAVTKRYVDGLVPGGAAGVTSWNGRAGVVTMNQVDVTNAGGLLNSGGTMTGLLVLSADPTAALGAATKQYVDKGVSTAGNGRFLPLSGGILTGPLTLPGDPTVALGAATKQYVDGKIGAGAGNFVLKTGDTMTGQLTLSPATGAATLALIKPAGTSANQAQIVGYTGGSLRWIIQPGNGTAESGGNAGSDFGIYNFDDAGNFISSPLTITRSNGSVNVAAHLGVGADATVAGAIRLTSGAYIYSDADFTYFNQDNGNWRWQYQRSTGLMQYIRGGDNATLFAIGAGADIYAGGSAAFGGIISSRAGRIVSTNAGANPAIAMNNTAIPYAMGFWVPAAGIITFGRCDVDSTPLTELGFLDNTSIGFVSGTGSIALNNGANALLWGDSLNFNLPGQAWKPGGGAFADSSDMRIKDVLGKYENGLEAILALQPVRYRPKNNWKVPGTKHQRPAGSKDTYVGLVAQEIEWVMPELVSRVEAELDGELVDDLRMVDLSALPLALVNAVKELAARVTTLEKAQI